jgi:hypothetical protein
VLFDVWLMHKPVYVSILEDQDSIFGKVGAVLGLV